MSLFIICAASAGFYISDPNSYALYSETALLYLFLIASYHALERREASKGGKEATKRAAATQQSGKSSSSSAAPRPSSSNGNRKHEPQSSNTGNHHSAKAPSKPSKPVPAYDEKVGAFRKYTKV